MMETKSHLQMPNWPPIFSNLQELNSFTCCCKRFCILHTISCKRYINLVDGFDQTQEHHKDSGIQQQHGSHLAAQSLIAFEAHCPYRRVCTFPTCLILGSHSTGTKVLGTKNRYNTPISVCFSPSQRWQTTSTSLNKKEMSNYTDSSFVISQTPNSWYWVWEKETDKILALREFTHQLTEAEISRT